MLDKLNFVIDTLTTFDIDEINFIGSNTYARDLSDYLIQILFHFEYSLSLQL